MVTARIVTDEKAPCSPPGMSLKDPILAAAYGGCVLKTKRKRYSVKDKLNAVKKVRHIVERDKVSFRQAAAKLSLDQGLVSKWQKEEHNLHNAPSKKVKSLGVGRKFSCNLKTLRRNCFNGSTSRGNKEWPLATFQFLSKWHLFAEHLDRSLSSHSTRRWFDS